MQVNEDIVAPNVLLLGEEAGLDGQIARVLDFEIKASDCLSIEIEGFRPEIAGLVEMSGGPDDHIGDLIHIGRQDVHANVYFFI